MTRHKSPKLTDRQLKYWITKHLNPKHCWIVVGKFDEIINEKNRCLISPTGDQLAEWQFGQLQFVYFAEFYQNILLTLVQDQSHYYLIRNQKESSTEPESEPSSTIYICNTLVDALAQLKSSERKQLGFKQTHNYSLRTRELTALEGVVAVDFINQPREVQVELWKRWVAQAEKTETKTLDLSWLFLITPDILETQSSTVIKSLILYQNNNLTDFRWIKGFPSVETISIWFINMLQESHLESLVASSGARLTSVEFHYCYQLSARALIPLARLNQLENLVFDNPAMSCQENTVTTVIKAKEWEKLVRDHSGLTQLKTLVLNSDNLTMDFIDYLLHLYPSLNRLVISEPLVDRVHQNTVPGYDHQELVIQAFTNLKHGFKIRKGLKFKSLLRDKFSDEVYSESMLRVIKQQHPDKYDEIMRSRAEGKNEMLID